MNPFVLAAVIVTVVAFLLELLCIALPFWLNYYDGGTTIHYYIGLFDICPSINGDYHACVGYTGSVIDVPAFWKAMRAMELLAIIAVFLAFVFGVVGLTCQKYSGLIHIVAGVCDLCAALFGLITVIVFGAKYTDLKSGWSFAGEHIHASFYLALFAIVFALVGGIFFFIGKPRATVKNFA